MLLFGWQIHNEGVITLSIAFFRKVTAFGMSFSTPFPLRKINQLLNIVDYTKGRSTFSFGSFHITLDPDLQ